MAPGAADAAAGHHEAQQAFLFMDSWAPDKAGRNGRRTARSFLMQNARRQRPWSTSKASGKQRRAAVDACPAPTTATASGVCKPRSKKTAPHPPAAPRGSREATAAQEPAARSTSDEPAARPDLSVLETDAMVCPSCKNATSTRPGWPCWQCSGALTKHSGEIEALGAENLDPFHALPVELSPRSMEVLSHFLSMMAPGCIPVDIHGKSDRLRSIWFKTALNSEACLHAVLAGAAGHLYILGACPYETLVHHKAKTVAAVNNSLCNPASGVEDANIAAVFSLLCIEEIMRPSLIAADEAAYVEGAHQRSIHLDGLLRMVQLRGGLRNLGSNPVVQSFLLWHATQHAIATFDAPYITMEDPDGTIPRYQTSPETYQAARASEMTTWAYAHEVCQEVVDLVIDVQMYTTDLNSWYQDCDGSFDALDLQNQACLLQCRLLRQLEEYSSIHDGPKDNKTRHRIWEEVFCLSLLMFVSRISRQDVSASFDPLQHTAVERLEKATTEFLTRKHVDEWCFNEHMTLSYWILVVGALCSLGHEMEEIFVQRCAAFVPYPQNRRGATSFADFTSRLREFAWVGCKLDMAARTVWDAMASQRYGYPLDTHISVIVPEMLLPSTTN